MTNMLAQLLDTFRQLFRIVDGAWNEVGGVEVLQVHPCVTLMSRCQSACYVLRTMPVLR